MIRQTSTRQNGHILLVTILALVVAVAGFFTWQYVQTKNNKNKETSQPSAQTESTSQDEPSLEPKVSDPSKGGKYLVIEEWGVHSALPVGLEGKVTYALGEPHLDPDKNQIQAAKIFVATSALPGNVCAATSTDIGSAIDSAAQYIRSEKDKPFDAERYRHTFKENVVADNQYHYHLNYVVPPCLENAANAELIKALQTSLVTLQKVQ